MKGAVQARRYVGDLARVLLGKEGQGSLKAIWCEDFHHWGLDFSSPGFWAKIGGRLGLQIRRFAIYCFD